MHAKPDTELLREYAEQGSEAAFRELVERHTDLVYSAALRQVASPDLAREVAQSVFTDLAHKARSLLPTHTHPTSLLGWLFQSTRFAALNQLRGERRRQTREKLAMEYFEPATPAATDWERLQPLLDEAMSDLSEDDREAVLLRFFQNRDFRAIGACLGVSDDAAQKRVSRALEKLRAQFLRRGITTTAVALSTALAAHAVSGAPAGLAATLAAAALAGTPLTAAVTLAATKAIVMTATQKTFIVATLAAIAGTGLYEARQIVRLRADVQTLQQQQAPLSEQIRQLTRERDAATNQLAMLAEELVAAKKDNRELLRLRAQVAQLRAQAPPATPVPTPAASDSTETTLKAWLDRVQLLKQSFATWPGKQTPELQLLSDQDWLNATAHRKLETDPERREAMGELRTEAKKRFAELVKKALARYAEANPQQVPSALSQLSPFFEAPLDPSVLEGYKIAPPGTVHPPKPGPAESDKAEVWALVEKDPPADRKYDYSIVIYNGGAGWWVYRQSE